MTQTPKAHPMFSPGKFVEIPGEFLAQIADDSDRIPRLYYADNWVLRRTFWQRLHVLHRLMKRLLAEGGSGLDLGGGSGVMLPTLSAQFRRVTLVDLEATQAVLVKKHYDLANVEIVQGDISALDFSQSRFDAAIAADVLEHFQDLRVPVDVLKRWLAPHGLLFTSLPTENWVYQILRKVFGIQKPLDHYHTGYEVEDFLESNGFQRVRTVFVPFYIPVAPLFLVSAWRLAR